MLSIGYGEMNNNLWLGSARCSSDKRSLRVHEGSWERMSPYALSNQSRLKKDGLLCWRTKRRGNSVLPNDTKVRRLALLRFKKNGSTSAWLKTFLSPFFFFSFFFPFTPWPKLSQKVEDRRWCYTWRSLVLCSAQHQKQKTRKTQWKVCAQLLGKGELLRVRYASA